MSCFSPYSGRNWLLQYTLGLTSSVKRYTSLNQISLVDPQESAFTDKNDNINEGPQ